MLFVSGLTNEEQRKVMQSHKKLLVESGIYSKEEILYHLNELPNQKFLDLEDALSPRLYKQLFKKYFE